MSNENLPKYIQALLQPAAFQHPSDEISLVQTHISYVILAGEYVYKFKKPVDFGFLDFTTLEKRHACCRQELLLNRRLSPEIYLDLVEVTRDNGGFELNGPGEVVEYGVKMARMPEDKMMVNVIKADQLRREHVDSLVDTLVPFYRQAERSNEIDRFGTADAVAVNVLENFDQTRDFVGRETLSEQQFTSISDYAREFLGRKEIFERRIKDGRIRDCHGDLYSANICLADKVYIYDCIEFNERFRYCDVASDIAFLAMDLDYHDLADLSQYFVERFSDASKDEDLLEVLDFYKCYRAYVRGKIGLFTAGDPAVDEAVRTSCMEGAAKYFQLAEKYAKQ